MDHRRNFIIYIITMLSSLLLGGCVSTREPVSRGAPDLRTAAVFYPTEIPLLISEGHDVNARFADGETALWAAVRFRELESVRLLLANGADPNLGRGGQSPLLCAAYCGPDFEEAEWTWIARLLIENGADVNARDPEYQDTALHFAVRKQNTSLARLLIEHGADLDAQSTPLGYAPLHCAVLGRDPQLVSILMKAGASVEIRTTAGQLPQDLVQGDDSLASLLASD